MSDHVGPDRRPDDIVMWSCGSYFLMQTGASIMPGLLRKFRQGCMIFGNATLGSELSEGTWRLLMWSSLVTLHIFFSRHRGVIINMHLLIKVHLLPFKACQLSSLEHRGMTTVKFKPARRKLATAKGWLVVGLGSERRKPWGMVNFGLSIFFFPLPSCSLHFHMCIQQISTAIAG